MLRELHISNLAVIADATVELDPGLNCFTGQTGAGKSLVIGALEILLGLRQPSDMLRKGASEGRVTGIFQINNKQLWQQIADVTDQPLADEPELMISRRIHESGRTSSSVNGHPITGAMLKAVGEILVDVHGQHDAQFLLKPGNQLAVIDDFGECTGLRQQFGELFRQRQELSQQQKELNASRTLRKQQLELYEFQAKEIDDAQPVIGEHAELEARHKLLSNLEKVKKQAGAAYGALYDEEGAVLERAKMIAGIIIELSEIDESLANISGQVREAVLSLEDAAFSLGRYVNKLDLDPAELAEVTDRLNLINRLINKYGGNMNTLDEVLAYRAQIGEQIATLRAQDEDFSSIGTQIEKIEKQLRTVGAELTKTRKKAADKLVPLIHAQLVDLGMKEARFGVEFQALQGVEGGNRKLGIVNRDAREVAALTLDDFSTASGFETVEFLIAPNPGQPARPLRRIASGGELSRIMLALKSILAQADRVSVLVFDEIDANVGGRMGTVIGEKLRHLASIHQVLCITHLPQIASFADRHITIRKKTEGGESFTTVTALTGEPRIAELAEMITGKDVSATSMAQARELLEIGTRSVASAARRPGPRAGAKR
jgi:DNA repair protein RecN (Recombination protein N)